MLIYSSQDPTNLDKFNLVSFHHLKNNLSVVDEGTVLEKVNNIHLSKTLISSSCLSGEAKAKQDPMYYIRKTNTETDSILNELQQTYKEPVSDQCVFN